MNGRGVGNHYDFKYRGYDPRTARFGSSDPLTRQYPWYTPYQFAGNRPIDCIDLEGKEPWSVVKRDVWQPVDQWGEKSGHLHVHNYRFTSAAAHLLSLVSGVPEADINKTRIANAYGTVFSGYDPNTGGGAMTVPGGDNDYLINYSDNYFSYRHQRSYSKDRSDDAYGWLWLSSHEVGHIRDIQEIGDNLLGYMGRFLASYAKSGGHDDNWREKRADNGTIVFEQFNAFVNQSFGNGGLIGLFEDSKKMDAERRKQIDDWWSAYQKH